MEEEVKGLGLEMEEVADGMEEFLFGGWMVGEAIEGWTIEEIELLDVDVVGVILVKDGRRLHLRGVLGQDPNEFVVIALEDKDGNVEGFEDVTFEEFLDFIEEVE